MCVARAQKWVAWYTDPGRAWVRGKTYLGSARSIEIGPTPPGPGPDPSGTW